MVRLPPLSLEEIASRYQDACHNGGPQNFITARQRLSRVVDALNQGILEENELDPIIIPQDYHTFPTRKDARVEALMTGLNSELKVVSLLTLGIDLKTGEPTTRLKSSFQIRQELESQGITGLPSVSTFLCSLSRDLSSTGLVATTRLGKGLEFEQSYFGLTVAGWEFGIPGAFQGLRRIVAYNQGVDLDRASSLQVHSLGQLGPSKGNGQGIANRIRVLGALNDAYVSSLDLARQLHLERVIVKEHLKALATYDLASIVGEQATRFRDPSFLLDYARDLRELSGNSIRDRDQRHRIKADVYDNRVLTVDKLKRAISVYSAFRRVRAARLNGNTSETLLRFVASFPTRNRGGLPRQCQVLNSVCGHSRRSVYNALKNLEESGQLTREVNGKGVYYACKEQHGAAS